MSTEFAIGRRTVGLTHPTYFIADVAANHDGSLDRAKDLIHLAAQAGADAAKFQNFLAPTIVSDFGFRALGSQQSHQAKWNKSIYEIYEAASLPMEWTEPLKEACNAANIDYLTAPYDLGLIDELSRYICAWKVGSGDITWLAIIEAMARSKLPMLIATGAADMEDVRRAVAAVRSHEDRIVLMQCNTNYTASLENFHHVALNVLKTYAREFPDVVLGLSDHTPGCGACAPGARIEVQAGSHFDRSLFHRRRRGAARRDGARHPGQRICRTKFAAEQFASLLQAPLSLERILSAGPTAFIAALRSGSTTHCAAANPSSCSRTPTPRSCIALTQRRQLCPLPSGTPPA